MRICDVCETKVNLSVYKIILPEDNGPGQSTYDLDLCDDCFKQLSINALIIGMKEIKKHMVHDAQPKVLVRGSK